MTAALLGLICALASTAGLAFLAITDPKRRRGDQDPRRMIRRWPAILLALGPGLWLAATGQGVSFLIWIGATAILGWATAALVNLRGSPARDRPWAA